MKYLLMNIIIGILAGWLAGKIMKGRGFGIFGDLIVGVVGSILGGVIFGALGLDADGFIGNLIMATIGAMALIFLARLFSGRV